MQAQWNVYDSDKEYQVLVSTAQGQTAIYKNVPCEVKLVSLKNKTLKLTSTNATVTPNAEPGSYSIQTSNEYAVLQIYSVKKTKMKLLKEIQIRTVDVPLLDELTLSGNSLSVGYSYNMQFASGYDPSPYDQQVFSKYYSVESWAFSCPAARKNLYGSGNQLSQEVTSFLCYLPEGVSYEIIAYHNGPINSEVYQPTVGQVFTSVNKELPAAKYVVLNNTPANKAWFDEKDQSSLIGMLNNNYIAFKDVLAGVFTESKSYNNKGSIFLRHDLITGIDPRGFPNRLNEKILIDNELSWDLKTIYTVDGAPEILPSGQLSENGDPIYAYWKKGSKAEPVVLGIEGHVDIFNPDIHTADTTQAEILPSGIPWEYRYRIKRCDLIYSTKNIEQIIIRYDSVLNISNGSIEIQPARVSLAKRLGKSDTLDIVFSIKYKDIMHFDKYSMDLFAPTLHITKENNPALFDLNNPSSPVYQLINKKELLNNSNFPYINGYQVGLFEELVQINGKKDSTLWETKISKSDVPELLASGQVSENGDPIYTYWKKGSNAEAVAIGLEGVVDVFDPSIHTADSTQAERAPSTGDPLLYYYVIKTIEHSQFKGFTDLFILQNYQFDPILKTNVSKPVYLGFGQRMPGQEKPTLIMKVSLNEFPVLDPKRINASPILYLNQPWAQSLIQNNFSSSEVIDVNNINLLQKKFHFKRQISDISTMETEVINMPHF
jgi:hypothetical protein